jgi:protein O-GlcNAc transferase
MTPQELQTLLRQAQSRHQSGSLPEAERDYLRLAEFAPANPDLWHLLGVIAFQQGHGAAAIERYRKAVELRRDFPQAHNNLAIALKSEGRLDEATASFAEALALKSDYAEAAYNLALLHDARGAFALAEQAYRQALAVKPEWLEALGNLGNLLRRERRAADAEPFLQRAMSLRSDDASAVGNLALLRIDQGRLVEGRTLAERAASLAPEAAQWWEAAGSAARLMKDADGAVPLLRRAAQLASRDAALWFELGLALEASADDAGAREALATARGLAPRWERLRWVEALLTPRIASSAEDVAAALQRFDAGLERLEQELRLDTEPDRAAALDAAATTLPFNLHYLPGDHVERQCRFGDLVARSVRAALPEYATALTARTAGGGGRLRVGFVSSHLRNHVVARYFAAFITQLDPARFETWAWFTADDGDAWTREMAAGVGHFKGGAPAIAAHAQDIRAAELDVLVYLDLGLDARQNALAALRLAPVQAACYGHPVTSGLDSVDYFVSGEALEPADAQPQYRERLVRLPGLGAQPRAPAAPGDGGWAEALRLEGRPLVMCLQNLSKIPPAFDAVVAQILARSGARLVCFDRGGGVSERFRRRIDLALRERGVDAAALHIERVHAYDEFLGGIAKADLVLDTPGFSGGATSLDALGLGVPVLAFEGDTARSRQTSAMLRLLALPELIAPDATRYVERAVALLSAGEEREGLRARLRERSGRLFDDREPLEAFARFLHESHAALRPGVT